MDCTLTHGLQIFLKLAPPEERVLKKDHHECCCLRLSRRRVGFPYVAGDRFADVHTQTLHGETATG